MGIERADTRHYRIGDYAHKMGVTPDLLKHYERMGLIHADTTDSGYRYYPFHESMALLECMGLRNYGIPLQEMERLMHRADLTEFRAILEEKAAEIRRHMELEQAVLEHERLFCQWMERMTARESYVLIEEKEEMLFLPHSRHRDFIEDERIQDLLPAWTAWMPVVKPSQIIPSLSCAQAVQESLWGLTVKASLAEKQGLPRNDVVQRIPGGRKLMLHYRLAVNPEKRNAAWRLMQAHIAERGIRVNGPIQQVVLARLRIGSEGIACGWFAIPFDEP